MTGSVFVLTGESEDVVRAWMREDIYGRSGVWDVERATIMPVSLKLLACWRVEMVTVVLGVAVV